MLIALMLLTFQMILSNLTMASGNNESQAFGVWQQLSESERTAAFAHTQRLQGDLSSRSYLYVYLRDKEWMKSM